MKARLIKKFSIFWLNGFLLGFFATCIFAEILPTKIYTTADGLLRDSASCIKQDSRGFMWFCSPGGLTRFDGYEFTNYTSDDGLPNPTVNDFLETRNRTIWLATNGGLVRFNPRGKRAPTSENLSPETAMFAVFKPSEKREETAFKNSRKTKTACFGAEPLMELFASPLKTIFRFLRNSTQGALKICVLTDVESCGLQP